VADDPERLAACLRVAGDWLAVGLDGRPERLSEVAWRDAAPRTLADLVDRLAAAGVRRFVLSHGGSDPDLETLAGLIDRSGAEFVLAGGITDVSRLPGIRDTGVRAVILGEALLGGAIDFTAAKAAAA
jgi:phosphoribosylformimino-5-aminoimidazole carboxamide ribonucleotide (ProFAR) isomerase